MQERIDPSKFRTHIVPEAKSSVNALSFGLRGEILPEVKRSPIRHTNGARAALKAQQF